MISKPELLNRFFHRQEVYYGIFSLNEMYGVNDSVGGTSVEIIFHNLSTLSAKH